MEENDDRWVNIIDAHVHAFPDKLFDAIWDYFDKNYWRVYKKYYAKDIIEELPKNNVDRFNFLLYAHRSNISRDLNNWVHSISMKNSKIIPFGTIHPDDPYFEEELERILSPSGLNFIGIKLQLMVTDFDPNDSKLDFMYETLIKYDKIAIIHAGTGPTLRHVKNKNLTLSPHVGVSKIITLMERFPKLRLQIPHLGAMECEDFFRLALKYKNLIFDTAMALEFIFLSAESGENIPEDELSLEEILDWFPKLQNQILFGSDFPNIPYAYSKSIEAILKLPIEEKIRKKILSENAVKAYRL